MTTSDVSAASTGPTTDYGAVLTVKVHYDDLDMMALLHNARYSVILERALTDYWDQHGYSYVNGKLGHPDAFVAVAEYSIKYRLPVRGTGNVAVHLWVDSVGESSVVYGFEILSLDGSCVHARGSRTQVRLDPQTLRPTQWAADTVAIYDSLRRPTSS